MKEKLNEIKIAALEKLNQVSDLQALESLRVEILGKKGELTQILKGMGSLSKEERPVIGQLANLPKVQLDIGRPFISKVNGLCHRGPGIRQDDRHPHALHAGRPLVL